MTMPLRIKVEIIVGFLEEMSVRLLQKDRLSLSPSISFMYIKSFL